MVTGRRGQIHTLEGIMAAMMLVLSLVFALQVSAVTPMTESTSSQHIENQQQAIGTDLLEAAAENGSLKEAVLYWNASEEAYPGTDLNGAYHHNLPDELQLATELERAFTDRGIAFNLHANYVEDGEVFSRTIVNQGEPSDHAVTATKLLTLYDHDEFTHDGGGELRAHEDRFYVPDEGAEPLYNVIEIELVIWRM